MLNGCVNQSLGPWKAPSHSDSPQRFGLSFSLSNSLVPSKSGAKLASKSISGLLIDVKETKSRIVYAFFDGKKYRVHVLKKEKQSSNFVKEMNYCSTAQIFSIERSPFNYLGFLVSTASGVIELMLPRSDSDANEIATEVSPFFSILENEGNQTLKQKALDNFKNAKFLRVNCDMTSIVSAYSADHRVFHFNIHKQFLSSINLFPSRPAFIKWMDFGSFFAVIPDSQDQIIIVETRSSKSIKIYVEDAGMKKGESFFISCMELVPEGIIGAGTFLDQIDNKFKAILQFWTKTKKISNDLDGLSMFSCYSFLGKVNPLEYPSVSLSLQHSESDCDGMEWVLL